MPQLIRAVCLLCILFISACQTSHSNVTQTPDATRGAVGHPLYHLAISQIEPAAKALCAERDKTANCNFTFALTNNRETTSSIVDGQGAIKVSRHMLAACETVDEVAFILAHEAGHQIADHHGPQLGFNASDTGFTLRSLNPKRLELEADVMAVILSDRAGFAPEAGMTAIRRFGGVFGVETKTHPDPKRRIDLVQKTIELIRAGHTITF